MRHIGSSNYSAAQIEEADRVARDRGVTRFVAAQNHYSLVERDVEDEVLPVCERLGIGMLPVLPARERAPHRQVQRGVEATEGRLAGREVPGGALGPARAARGVRRRAGCTAALGRDRRASLRCRRSRR